MNSSETDMFYCMFYVHVDLECEDLSCGPYVFSVNVLLYYTGMHCHMVPTSDCLLRLQCDPLRTASETSQPTTAKRPRIDAAQHKHNKTRSLIACALETLHDASYDLLSNSVSALLKGSCKLPGLTDEEKSVTSAFCLNKDPPGNICSTITNTLKALLEDKRLTFQKSSCGRLGQQGLKENLAASVENLKKKS
ncbi:uncharacterized protein LOC124389743 isoform X2 [Silurus meridionalis]|uniref:uncharacterized protein LOC124389743 isoform X2 n=1 Tax=Silurus meridionalis TaxID=175797 RepID=UPI001EEA7FA4|nr:uncharacterized protein LOC124389743 isoform X2 [Silurus meridionalis]XP_046711168.1 uncharacterized protein LOC124389743 isoform X2 [Silurus meridionalis]